MSELGCSRVRKRRQLVLDCRNRSGWFCPETDSDRPGVLAGDHPCVLDHLISVASADDPDGADLVVDDLEDRARPTVVFYRCGEEGLPAIRPRPFAQGREETEGVGSGERDAHSSHEADVAGVLRVMARVLRDGVP